jgi:hypothetical protein
VYPTDNQGQGASPDFNPAKDHLDDLFSRYKAAFRLGNLPAAAKLRKQISALGYYIDKRRTGVYRLIRREGISR